MLLPRAEAAKVPHPGEQERAPSGILYGMSREARLNALWIAPKTGKRRPT